MYKVMKKEELILKDLYIIITILNYFVLNCTNLFPGSIYEMDPIQNDNTANVATLRRQHAHMLKIGSIPPFPDDSMSNIDWFVQVILPPLSM